MRGRYPDCFGLFEMSFWETCLTINSLSADSAGRKKKSQDQRHHTELTYVQLTSKGCFVLFCLSETKVLLSGLKTGML